MRSSRFTALELAQTLRYLPDLVVVLALLAAVGLCAPNRARSRWLDASRARTAVIVGLTAAFVASSLYSTATFLTSWRDNPAQPYLQNTRAGLAAAALESDAPMLDQEVDPMVLQRVAAPENLASHMFALLRERPEFARRHNRITDAGFQRASGGRQGHVGADDRRRPGSAVRLLRPARLRGDDAAGRPTACLPIGPRRSTTWPTAKAR